MAKLALEFGQQSCSTKRAIRRSMPAYFLDDFKLDKDDMNRSFTLSLNAYGVCKIDKRKMDLGNR